MEPRSAMAYWVNGKLHLYASTQSVIRTVDNIANWLAIDPAELVLVSEYCGGGFGSKGGGPISMAIPALLAKKANAPVMMRVSREEEHFIGRGRTNMTGRAKVAFRKDGRIAGIDLFIVQDNGSYGSFGDFRSAGNAVSVLYQPMAMRWRGVSVLTNTPPRSQQRSPGWMQANGLMESAITKAAKQLGIDQVEIRKINAPEGKATYGAPRADGIAPPPDERVRQASAGSRQRAVPMERAEERRPVLREAHTSAASAWPSAPIPPGRSASTA